MTKNYHKVEGRVEKLKDSVTKDTQETETHSRKAYIESTDVPVKKVVVHYDDDEPCPMHPKEQVDIRIGSNQSRLDEHVNDEEE